MNVQEQADRTARLKSEFVTITVEAALYNKLARLMQLARQHLDDMDPALYELGAERLDELNNLVANPLNLSAASATLQLSHLDLFDIESTSYMAEGFPQDFGGEAALGMSFKELAALTDMFESYRKRAFAEEYEELS